MAGLFLIFTFILPQLVNAATFDPSRRWMTITTPHFFIRYAQENEVLAKRSADVCEEAYEDLSTRFNWKTWGRTEVVFLDSADIANGMATVIPYNWVLLYASPPLPDEPLGYYDNWLRLLIYHEMTHIFHMDAARGWWKAFRFVLGKTVAPAGTVPNWVKEGEAVYVESSATNAGRDRSSFTEMMLRTSLFQGDFPSISRGDGFQWTWPSYNIPYLYGGEFIEYLVDKYGFDKLIAFNDRTQRTFMLSMVNYAARTVYGKTFVQLWKEWREYLSERYDVQRQEIERKGVTHIETLIPIDPKWEEYISAPAISPDGYNVAYSVTSPHHSSELRFIDLETGKVETFVKKKSATQISWHPDGSAIVFSSLSSAKRSVEGEVDDDYAQDLNFEFGIVRDQYYDLWWYDFDRGKLSQLTSGARARDPDFSKDGKRIVYIARDEKADESLMIFDVETSKSHAIIPNKTWNRRYANPRFSPDGKSIAVVGWDPKNMWKVYIYSTDGKNVRRLTKAKKGVELRPWWTPDGRYILHSSDATGVTNIYRTNVKTGKSEQLSNVLSGAYQPTTKDGRNIFVQYYTSRGFELSEFAVDRVYPTDIDEAEYIPSDDRGITFTYNGQQGHETWAKPAPVSVEYSPKKYTPWGKSLFLPRYLIPNIAYIEDNFLFALATGGADVLRWHNWALGATYLTGARKFGYFARYWYNRWKPIFGIGINEYIVNYGVRTFILTGPPQVVDTRQYYERRRNAFAFVTYPMGRHAFSISYNFEQRNPASTLLSWERQALTLGRFAGFAAVYAYGDSEYYPASISRENGRSIRLRSYWTNKYFGSSSNNEQVVFVGDWREYVRLWHHHVLAFRVMGGMTWGDQINQGTFVVGGSRGEGTFAPRSSLSYFPLRGLPNAAIGATRAMIMSMEYRFPIVDPQRGLGTWPIGLKSMHGAIFADYGDGWLADQKPDRLSDFFDNFYLGVGAEIRGDFVIGHGLPVKGRLGYAIIVVNRDRLFTLEDPILKHAAKYGVLILEFGTSF